MQSSLERVQGYLLLIKTRNFTALKVNGIKEDIFYIKFWGPAWLFLHFVQNYASSVSKNLQSWCRALITFYQTSLLPLCNIFYHVYEKSLK